VRATVVGLVGVMLAVSACSTGNPEGAPTPQQICEKALTTRVVSSGPLTTVGDLRGLTEGSGYQPAKNAFPKLPASAAASYCWTAGNGEYLSFGVTLDRQKVSLGGISGSTEVPSGPPVIP
jgi:hypothetical protein